MLASLFRNFPCLLLKKQGREGQGYALSRILGTAQSVLVTCSQEGKAEPEPLEPAQ